MSPSALGIVASGRLSSGIIVPSYSAEVMADGPSGYWRLGESGTVVADSSGLNRHGSIGGTAYTREVPGLISGDSDKATAFSSASYTYADVPVDNVGTCSYEVIGSGLAGNILDRDGSPGSRCFQIQTGGNTAGWIIWTVPSGGPLFVPANSWRGSVGHPHHLAFTISATAARTYMDGYLIGELTGVGTLVTDGPTLMRIGNWRGGNQPYTGVIDEVAAYNKELSAARVLAHAQAAGLPGYVWRPSTSSEVNASNLTANAFDGDLGTQWLSAANTGWIQAEFISAKIMTQYTVRNHGNVNTFQAKDWTFEAWNGTSWVVLQTVVNKVWGSTTEAHTFNIPSPAAYTKYRVNVSANQGGFYVGFSEFSWVLT